MAPIRAKNSTSRAGVVGLITSSVPMRHISPEIRLIVRLGLREAPETRGRTRAFAAAPSGTLPVLPLTEP
jgi:hypothetical protein